MDVKRATQEAVERIRTELVDLSHRIHATPEIGFEEERSSEWVATALSDGGLDVEAGVCGLPTAFVARAGTGPLHIGICAEYDALPGIGHACGHNLIAASAVGAGIALAQVADDLGITVSVFGTPAEEGGGGKIIMLDGGAFEGVHAAMMVHPAPMDLVEARPLAVSHFEVRFAGKSAHASAFPQVGINAADALTVSQVGIGLLRQHMPHHCQIHGIVTKGGDAPNVVPEATAGRWYVRGRDLAQVEEFEPRVHKCFEAGALATGCELEIERQSKPYSEFRNDLGMAAKYRANASELGRRFPDASRVANLETGSTDMANISLAIPAIHPMMGIESLPAVNHQPEFAAHCAKPVADAALADAAVAMAWTVADLAVDPLERKRLLDGPTPA
jgi:amidohydrolase